MRESQALELLLWVLRRRQRYRVTGASMQPGLRDGDEVLVDPHAYRFRSPRAGEVVIARHPQRAGLRIIKRVMECRPDGRFLLEGDNPDPTRNSPAEVPGGLIRGRVTSRFASSV